MAQFVVRNLEDAVKVRLQRRARRHGHSMEEEIREILRSAANQDSMTVVGMGTEIANLFSKIGLENDIPEWRGQLVRPATFEP